MEEVTDLLRKTRNSGNKIRTSTQNARPGACAAHPSRNLKSAQDVYSSYLNTSNCFKPNTCQKLLSFGIVSVEMFISVGRGFF
jgi:hypothetical protein